MVVAQSSCSCHTILHSHQSQFTYLFTNEMISCYEHWGCRSLLASARSEFRKNVGTECLQPTARLATGVFLEFLPPKKLVPNLSLVPNQLWVRPVCNRYPAAWDIPLEDPTTQLVSAVSLWPGGNGHCNGQRCWGWCHGAWSCQLQILICTFICRYTCISYA